MSEKKRENLNALWAACALIYYQNKYFKIRKQIEKDKLNVSSFKLSTQAEDHNFK